MSIQSLHKVKQIFGIAMAVAFFTFSVFWDSVFLDFFLWMPVTTILFGWYTWRYPFWSVFLLYFGFSLLYSLLLGYNLWFSVILYTLFFLYWVVLRTFDRNSFSLFLFYAVYYVGQKMLFSYRWIAADVFPFCILLLFWLASEQRQRVKRKRYKSMTVQTFIKQ